MNVVFSSRCYLLYRTYVHIPLADTLRSVAAYSSAFISRERVRLSSEQGHPARVIQSRGGPHDQVVATIKKMTFPLNNREFVARQVCATDTSGDLLITVVPIGDVIDYGMSTRTVRGVSRALMRFTPSGESQCKVTYIQYLDAGGVIPTRVVESNIPLALRGMGELRDEFQRDVEIDKMERNELVRVMKEEQQVYSEDEDSLIQRVQDKIGALKKEDFEELESPDHLVKMGKTHAEGSSSIVLRGSTTIDASVEMCAAWEVSKMSREQLKGKRSLLKSLTKANDHSALYHVAYDLRVPGLSPREFLTQVAWKWRTRGRQLVAAYDNAELPAFPLRAEYVRGSSTAFFVYDRLDTAGGVQQTRVTFTTRVDVSGSVPSWFATKGSVSTASAHKQNEEAV